MSYEDKITEFLAQPENLPIAFQVAEYLEKLKEKTHQQFWSLFSEEMNGSLHASEFATLWTYQPFPQEQWQKPYATCSIRPVPQKPAKQPFLMASFQQGSSANHFQLLMGIQWSVIPPSEFQSSTLDALKSDLKAQGFKLYNAQWPNWKWMDYRLIGQDFILRMHQLPNETVAEVGEEIWQLFLQVRPQLEAINREVVGV